MAKKVAAPKFVPPTEVEVAYDLDRLPSAQHKAGLAGLLLHIEDMAARRDKGLLKPDNRPIPEVVAQTSTTATIQFSAESAQSLFDDLYDAQFTEVRSKTRWKEKEGKATKLKRIESNPNPKPGEPREWFIYDVEQPSGHFLASYTEGDKEHWHKLWRDMLYAVPRNKPTTRQAYKTRSEGNPTKEGSDAWKSLVDREKARFRGAQATVELAGSLMLAVQTVTAEAVPFLDRVEDQILLHFWVLTARTFVPQIIDEDGKGEFVGYALAIPEVADIGQFNRAYKRWLLQLGTGRVDYRPRGAVVALPEQGPLELLDNFDRLVSEKVLEARPARFLSGVEFFYLVDIDSKKRKLKDVKLRGHGRVPVVEELVEKYRSLSEAYHNPVFLKGLLLAMLRDRPWFAELKAPLHERDWSFLVHCTQERQRTPRDMIGFAWEVRKKFFEMVKETNDSMESPAENHNAVDAIVFQLVGEFVKERACRRAGVEPDDPKWFDKTAEERRDVGSKFFLEMRSRHGDDFVNYFTDTIASVAQRRLRYQDSFLLVVQALMNTQAASGDANRPRNRDDIKLLTMLALSGQSAGIRLKETTPAATAPETPQ